MNLASIKRRLKRRWLNLVGRRRVFAAFLYDQRRYLSYSSTFGPWRGQVNLGARITERYHAIEKALSLPEPRPGFGAKVIPELLGYLEAYADRYGADHITAAAAGALAGYVDFNEHVGLKVDQLPASRRLQAAIDRYAPAELAGHGQLRLNREQIAAATAGVDLDFFTSRHSTRVFADTRVSADEVAFAVRAAMTAPAVCNREFSAVHIWQDRNRIDQILALQGGAKGFAAGVPALAMVTVNQRAYWSADERNQCWIDGGSFAMAFILGLHAQGLGAVPLNWSKPVALDRRMRAEVNLPEDRAIIMFVGFGHLQPDYPVAASPRRPATEFGHLPGVR